MLACRNRLIPISREPMILTVPKIPQTIKRVESLLPTIPLGIQIGSELEQLSLPHNIIVLYNQPDNPPSLP